jgi:WhiB family transcriptional regulator, redox-sensing transcriptional regulator
MTIAVLMNYEPIEAWKEDGRCRGLGERVTIVFYPERGGNTKEAKAICKKCPVKQTCLDYALENNMTDGIWGGMTEGERKRLKRQRRA